MIQKTDVLICGSGSAGLCAATWLARTGINCKILEKRPGPMELGQADGVQCRTVEVFESFGLAEDLLRDAYHVLEVAFWSSNSEHKLICTKRTPDTISGLSHQPHVILNQAKVNGLLLDAMRRFGGPKVDYGYSVKDVKVESAEATDAEEYPVTVTAEKDGVEEVFKAKYVLGCDGAHSTIRRSLGYQMIGDSTDAVWGVMDIYPRTNFPDIRKKVTLHSDYGNLLIIPREGGSLVRFYIELPHGTAAKDVRLEDLHKAARQIFQQYTLDIADTFWWSAYSIGQRLVDHFSKDDRVFLTGDACHTHSPKAGQGMNVSLQDGYNIGWKLAAVLKGHAPPSLLQTYSSERQKVAADLIAFDRRFTKLWSMKVSDGDANGATAQHFSEQFTKAGRYTAGLTTTYDDSAIVSAARSKQSLARNLVVGMRLPSAQVVRFCDARAMQLVRALPADGRWRIIILAGDMQRPENGSNLQKLADFLSSPAGPILKYTPQNADIDSFVEPIVVLHGERAATQQEQIPSYFWPVTGEWQMRDLHKIFIDDESYNSGHGHAYEKYGVSVEEGAVAIVRPDQYVSIITSITDYQAIGDFFEAVALPQR